MKIEQFQQQQKRWWKNKNIFFQKRLCNFKIFTFRKASLIDWKKVSILYGQSTKVEISYMHPQWTVCCIVFNVQTSKNVHLYDVTYRRSVKKNDFTNYSLYCIDLSRTKFLDF